MTTAEKTVHVIKFSKGDDGTVYRVPDELVQSVREDQEKVRISQSEAPTQPVTPH